MPYATDTDLLDWEPTLFSTAAFVSQTLFRGVGDLAGIAFTLDAGSFVDSHIQPGQVITLTGSPILAGCYPIVTVDSTDELTLSILYEGLRQSPPVPSPIGAASDLDFSICTFRAQIDIVSQMLDESAGVHEGVTITNPDALRAPCVLGTLQMIYRALAATAEEPQPLLIRTDLYERLFRRAMRSAKVELDTNGDGIADTVHPLNLLALSRV